MGDDMHKRSLLRTFYADHRRMPSYQEIAKLFGLRSKDSAYSAVEKMLEDGFIEKDGTGRLLPGPSWGQVKLLGLVEAGFPTPAEEDLLESTTLDEYLIGNRDATFMLRVKGDSMYDAGIRDGDMVLVERSETARVGDIVVAEVDGAFTMKYLRTRGKQLYLEPANRRYQPIVPKEELRIAAVVRAVIRKYDTKKR